MVIGQVKEFLHNYKRSFWHGYYYWLAITNCADCPYYMKTPGRVYDWDCVNYTPLKWVLK